MSKMSDTADSVLGLAERFQAILDMADVLKGLGSIEQAMDERKTALVTATAEHDDMQSKVVSVKDELEALEQNLKNGLQAYQNAADAIHDSAIRDAEGIRATANSDAKKLVETAGADAVEIQNAHADIMVSLNGDLAVVRNELTATRAAVDQANAELLDLQRKTEALKQQAKDIFGGKE